MDAVEVVTPKKPRYKRWLAVLLWLPLFIWKWAQYLYYRTGYLLYHKWRIKEFIFINYWVMAFLAVILITLYALLHRGPVYLALPALSTELYVAENTLRTVSIFIGIVFSFIVLSFNVFYKYFGRFAFVQFFTSKYIKFIFTLFIGDMMLLIYTCGYLKEGGARNTYGDSLFIFSLLISVFLVLAIIPTLILLLRSSQNRDNIRQLIAQFDGKWAVSYQFNVLWKMGDENAHLQRDPITLLMEIGTDAIKDFDRNSIIAIKDGCLEHLKKLHADYKIKPEVHPDTFYHKLNELTRNLFPVAIKERNENAALMIVNFQLRIEQFYITNFKDFNPYQQDDHYYDGILFMVVIKEFLLKSLQFNEDGVSETIINKLREWWKTVIDVYFPAIGYDYPKGERFPTDKPTLFIGSAYYEFNNIFELVFTYKKLFLYREVATFFGVLNAEIVGSKNTRSTVVYLLQRNGSYLVSLFEKFIDTYDGEITASVYPFGHGTTQELTHIQSQGPLQYELRAFEYLFRKNKLNAYVINGIKAIAYHSMHHFSEDGGYKKALLSIIEKFDFLRSLVAETAEDRQKETYLLLERYLGYILEWTPEYKIVDEEVLSVLHTALGKFGFKEKFTKELDSKGHIIKDVR
jgi:hypothetical protein